MGSLAWYWRPVQWLLILLAILTCWLWVPALLIFAHRMNGNHEQLRRLVDMDNLP